MSLYDNVSGLLLDKNRDRTIHIVLPLIKRARTYELGDDMLHQMADTYGEMIFFGDWHMGNDSFAKNPFGAYVNMIKDNPHMRVILMGDYFEFSGKSEYISDEKMDIDDQIDLFIKILKTLKDQVDVILSGNHDHRITKYTGRRKYLHGFAEQAGIDMEKVYIGYPQRGANIFVDAGKYRYSVYCIHGSTGAWRNKNTQLKRMAVARRHTVLAMGHVHQVLWEPSLYLEPCAKDSTIEVRLQYWLATGGFLKDASYAETRSYPPSLVGSPIVRFFASKNELDMWQLPYRSHYFDENPPLEDVEGLSEVEKVKMALRRRTFVGDRPPCPRCGKNNIISRGIQWQCKDCNKYFMK